MAVAPLTPDGSPAVPATPVARDGRNATRSTTAAQRLDFGGRELTEEACSQRQQLEGGESAAEAWKNGRGRCLTSRRGAQDWHRARGGRSGDGPGRRRAVRVEVLFAMEAAAVGFLRGAHWHNVGLRTKALLAEMEVELEGGSKRRLGAAQRR
jgi:hypothetical protein